MLNRNNVGTIPTSKIRTIGKVTNFGSALDEAEHQRGKKYFFFSESGIKGKYFLPFFTTFDKVLALIKV